MSNEFLSLKAFRITMNLYLEYGRGVEFEDIYSLLPVLLHFDSLRVKVQGDILGMM